MKYVLRKTRRHVCTHHTATFLGEAVGGHEGIFGIAAVLLKFRTLTKLFLQTRLKVRYRGKVADYKQFRFRPGGYTCHLSRPASFLGYIDFCMQYVTTDKEYNTILKTRGV